MSMASNWRVHPMEQQIDRDPGMSAAVSTSSYGGLHMPRLQKKDSVQSMSPVKTKERSETQQASSLDMAYWSGMRKRAGLSTLNTSEVEDEKEKYKQYRRNMERYVESNFRQFECIKFIPKPNQNVKNNRLLKCYCGEILSLHSWGSSIKEPGTVARYVHEDFVELARDPMGTPPKVLSNVKWDPKLYLQEKATFTYGKMEFNVESSQGKKPAKYLRLSSADSVDSCLEFMEIYWRIMEPTPPNLVISVVGGAKNFVLDGEMRETFSNGLIKAAKTTNAWLITSGFNMGVMKSVGQAVNEGQAFLWDNDRMTHLLRCIAIAPWGYVYNRRFLEAKNKKGKFNAYYRSSNMILHGQPVSLNPDHTHFIFVDDGYRNRYGGVADFRARFEKKLCTPKTENGYGIPVVMMVLEGGPDSIQDACQSLKEGIPVVVCTGTGRAADFLTYAHKFTHKNQNEEKVMHERHERTLRERVKKAYSKNWREKAEEELKKTMNNIRECMKRDHLMIFFDLRREEDLDVAILSVLTKAETASGVRHRLNQLELALTWNRADIAQSEIFREDVNWDANDLYQIMDKALRQDKMSFVRLLLNQGMSMKEYLTVQRLENLYNFLPKHGYLYMLLKRQLRKEEFTIKDIGRFLRTMLERFDDEKFTQTDGSKDKGGSRIRRARGIVSSKRPIDTTDTEVEEEPEQFQQPYKQLLIWAVLLNRPELAKFFWEMGEEPITSALSVSLLCVKMHRIIPKYLHSIRQEFLVMKKMFEGLATKVLDECHAVDPEKAVMLVEKKSPSWSRMTCLQIAAAANNQLFVSSVACQNSVNNVWKSGILSDWRRVFVCSLLPFLAFPIIRVAEMGDKPLTHMQRFFTFYSAPITKFTYYMLFYLAFLMTYSYMILVDFREYPSQLEIFLMIWIISFFVNEVHTFFVFPSPTFKGKVRDWLGFLNRLDMCNLLLAFIGFILRYDSKYYVEAKTVYCINIVIFYIRVIKVYIANSHLGPKLYMIFRMVEELVMFMVVLVVFLLAYGVCSQGLLYKRREPSFDIIKDLIQFPYWQLYGELFLEEIETDTQCIEQLGNGSSIEPYHNNCREAYWLVYIMLGLYLLVGNVLLLNLLIAIFSNVFNQVEENSIEIWKYQMYFLVMEFQVKAKLAPPLSIFEHFYILLRFIYKRTCRKKKNVNQFSQHHLAYMALFEKEMMGNYLRRLKFESLDSMHRRFIKLQKRVDMLNKIIEDRHVEDELNMQSSLSLDDGLKILSATVGRVPPGGPASTSDTPSTSGLGPMTSNIIAEMAAEALKDGKQEEEKKEKESRVTFSLTKIPEEREEKRLPPLFDEMSRLRKPELSAPRAAEERNKAFSESLPEGEEDDEEDDKKKKKKKKRKEKKEKRQKSKERQPSVERKELNINIPERDTKPEIDKQISDDNNEGATATPTSVRRPRSRSPDPNIFFMRSPIPRSLQAPTITTTSTDADFGEEPDDESEDEVPARPPRPQKRQSRGQLNMLSLSQSDARLISEDEELSENSDYEYRRRQPPSPRHKKKKDRRDKKKDKKDKKEKKKRPARSSESSISERDSD